MIKSITAYINFYGRATQAVAQPTFRIRGSDGRLVKQYKTDNLDATFIVPVWDLPAGAYWLQYCVGREAVISKQFQILK